MYLPNRIQRRRTQKSAFKPLGVPFRSLPIQQTSTHSGYRRNPQVTYTTGGNGDLSRRSRSLPHVQEKACAFPGQELPHQFSDADSESKLSLFSLTDSVEEFSDINVHTRVTAKTRKTKLCKARKASPMKRNSQRSPVRAKVVYHETNLLPLSLSEVNEPTNPDDITLRRSARVHKPTPYFSPSFDKKTYNPNLRPVNVVEYMKDSDDESVNQQDMFSQRTNVGTNVHTNAGPGTTLHSEPTHLVTVKITLAGKTKTVKNVPIKRNALCQASLAKRKINICERKGYNKELLYNDELHMDSESPSWFDQTTERSTKQLELKRLIDPTDGLVMDNNQFWNWLKHKETVCETISDHLNWGLIFFYPKLEVSPKQVRTHLTLANVSSTRFFLDFNETWCIQRARACIYLANGLDRALYGAVGPNSLQFLQQCGFSIQMLDNQTERLFNPHQRQRPLLLFHPNKIENPIQVLVSIAELFNWFLLVLTPSNYHPHLHVKLLCLKGNYIVCKNTLGRAAFRR